jgi:hypothetical protein
VIQDRAEPPPRRTSPLHRLGIAAPAVILRARHHSRPHRLAHRVSGSKPAKSNSKDLPWQINSGQCRPRSSAEPALNPPPARFCSDPPKGCPCGGFPDCTSGTGTAQSAMQPTKSNSKADRRSARSLLQVLHKARQVIATTLEPLQNPRSPLRTFSKWAIVNNQRLPLPTGFKFIWGFERHASHLLSDHRLKRYFLFSTTYYFLLCQSSFQKIQNFLPAIAKTHGETTLVETFQQNRFRQKKQILSAH